MSPQRNTALRTAHDFRDFETVAAMGEPQSIGRDLRNVRAFRFTRALQLLWRKLEAKA
ncbi:MAG: hypothetical protein P1U62_13490 [Alteraurantiacibacter sp. bin_em_oilr2.035]|uniref:hypothetical protein n=1 Tax=Aurantiacibacter atlanticus TaxID=1648404 RepID=UPI0013730A1E|nr:hypothetical protein [Aurantiacibacter atlanticus]MDF1835877.1 hypothetical protein [Alteraurantiacibacter sp. bin_em_oilr2.035]